jgi:Putative prokaryotic signal transducing protein
MALEANNAALVKVFDTEQESEAMVVQGLLESAGIESLISSLDAPQDVLPGVGGVIVQVRPDQADEARTLIQDFRANGEPDAEFTEEPTA